MFIKDHFLCAYFFRCIFLPIDKLPVCVWCSAYAHLIFHLYAHIHSNLSPCIKRKAICPYYSFTWSDNKNVQSLNLRLVNIFHQRPLKLKWIYSLLMITWICSLGISLQVMYASQNLQFVFHIFLHSKFMLSLDIEEILTWWQFTASSKK